MINSAYLILIPVIKMSENLKFRTALNSNFES